MQSAGRDLSQGMITLCAGGLSSMCANAQAPETEKEKKYF